ncbi:MAG: hypothetical protein AMJ65_08155, partial [Phycisphaerae bacterium SG8_4]
PEFGLLIDQHWDRYVDSLVGEAQQTPEAHKERLQKAWDYSQALPPLPPEEAYPIVDILDRSKKRGRLEELKRGFAGHPIDILPWASSIAGGIEVGTAYMAKVRLDDPEFDYEAMAREKRAKLMRGNPFWTLPLTDFKPMRVGIPDELTDQQIAEDITAERLRERDLKTWGDFYNRMAELEENQDSDWFKYGKGLQQLIPWGIEIASTAGLYRYTNVSARKMLQRHMKNRIGKKVAGWFVGSAITSQLMVHRTFKNTMEQQMQHGRGWAYSTLYGWGETAIEYGSEQAGGGIIGAAGKGFQKLPFGKLLVEKFGQVWMKASPKNTWSMFVKNTASRHGWHGMLGELTEEELATILHGITGTETFGLPADAPWEDRLVAGLKQDLDEIHITAGVLAAPGGAQVTISHIGQAVSRIQMARMIQEDVGVSKPVAQKAVQLRKGPGLAWANAYLTKAKVEGEEAANQALADKTLFPEEAEVPPADLQKVFGKPSEVVSQFRENEKAEFFGFAMPIFSTAEPSVEQKQAAASTLIEAIEGLPLPVAPRDRREWAETIVNQVAEQAKAENITDQEQIKTLIYERAAAEIAQEVADLAPEAAATKAAGEEAPAVGAEGVAAPAAGEGPVELSAEDHQRLKELGYSEQNIDDLKAVAPQELREILEKGTPAELRDVQNLIRAEKRLAAQQWREPKAPDENWQIELMRQWHELGRLDDESKRKILGPIWDYPIPEIAMMTISESWEKRGKIGPGAAITWKELVRGADGKNAIERIIDEIGDFDIVIETAGFKGGLEPFELGDIVGLEKGKALRALGEKWQEYLESGRSIQMKASEFIEPGAQEGFTRGQEIIGELQKSWDIRWVRPADVYRRPEPTVEEPPTKPTHEMTFEEYKEQQQKKGPRESVGNVPSHRQTIMERGENSTVEMLQAIDEQFSSPTFPETVLYHIAARVAHKNRLDTSEMLARLYVFGLQKLATDGGPEAAGSVFAYDTVKKASVTPEIEADAEAAGMDAKKLAEWRLAAQMFLVGSINSPSFVLRQVRSELATERGRPAGITQYPKDAKHKPVSMEYLAELGEIARGEVFSMTSALPLPLRNATELSFQRMAEEGPNAPYHANWPFVGRTRITGTGAELPYQMVEDMTLVLLQNKRSGQFEYEGNVIDVPASRLSSDQIVGLQQLLDKADRDNIDPFPYVWDQMLSSPAFEKATKKAWEHARKLLHRAAIGIWEQKQAAAIQANPFIRMDQGVSWLPSKKIWRAKVTLPGEQQRDVGQSRNKEEAIAKRRQYLIARTGKDYHQYDLHTMPRLQAFPDYDEQVVRVRSIDIAPRMFVQAPPLTRQGDVDLLIKKHRQAGYTKRNTAIKMMPGQYPQKPTAEQIIENRGKEWYDDYKDENIQILGRTYFDRDSGRITSEIYIEDARRARILAEELYHPIYEIIRATSPRYFGQIQRWYAGRKGYTKQRIDEAFSKEMALIETGALRASRSALPGGVVTVAQDIFSGKRKVKQDTMDKVAQQFLRPQLSIGEPGIRRAYHEAIQAAIESGETISPEISQTHARWQMSQSVGAAQAGFESYDKMIAAALVKAERSHQDVYLSQVKPGEWQIMEHVPMTGHFTIVRTDKTVEFIKQASLTAKEAFDYREKLKGPILTDKVEQVRQKFKDKLENVDALREELRQFLRASLPPSREKDVAMGYLLKIRPQSRDVTNIKNFEAALLYTDMAAENLRKAQAIADYKNTIRDLRKVYGTKGGTFGRMRPEYARRIEQIVGAIDPSKMTTRKRSDLVGLQAKIHELTDALADGLSVLQEPDPDLTNETVLEFLAIPQGRISELRRLGQTPLPDMTAQEIESINESLALLVAHNELKNSLMGKREAQELQEALATIIEQIQPSPRAKKGEVPSKAGITKRMSQLAGETLPTAIFRTFGGFDNTAANFLLWDVLEGLSQRYVLEREIKQFVQTEFDKAGIDYKLVKKWRKTTHKYPGIPDVNAKEHTPVELNEEQLLSILMDLRNPDNRAAAQMGYQWKTRKFTRGEWRTFHHSTGPLSLEQLGQLVEPLGKKHKLAADIANAVLDEHTKRALSETSLRIYNHDLFRVPRYWAMHRVLPRSLGGAKANIPLSERGFTKERQGGSQPLWLTPFFGQLGDSIEQSAAYAKMLLPLFNAKSILANKDWQDAMKRQGRMDEMDQIIDTFLRMEQAATSRDALEMWSGALMRNYGRSVLGLYFGSILAQYASEPMLASVDPVRYFKHAAIYSEETQAEIDEHSGLLWKRHASGRMDRDIGDVAATDAVDNFFFDHRGLFNQPMRLQMATDNRVLQKAWRMAKDYVETELKLKADHKDYWSAVERRALELSLTQPNWEPFLRSELLTSKAKLTRFLMAFRSPIEAMYNSHRRALAAVENSLPGANKQLTLSYAAIISSLLVYRVIKELYWAAVENAPRLAGLGGPDEDDDDRPKIPERLVYDVINLGPPGVVLSPLVERLVARIMDRRTPRSVLERNPLAQVVARSERILDQLGTMVQKYIDGDPDWDDNADRLAIDILTVSSYLAGAPVSSLVSMSRPWLENDPELYEKLQKQMSPYQVRKRLKQRLEDLDIEE